MSVTNITSSTTPSSRTTSGIKPANPIATATANNSISSKRPAKMTSTQSLNHLLNFTLPPRQSHPPQSIPRRSRKTGTQYGFWNKEKFLNAQYRFVMKPTGDYTVHFADPDIYFQWQDILQVIVPRTSALAAAAAGRDGDVGDAQALSTANTIDEGVTTCPICLSPPSAPRMTKCGHVFCFPCILHYLSTSENQKWHRCPICFDSVNEKQLKCVKWYDEGTADSPHTSNDLDDGNAEASSSASSSAAELPVAGSVLRMRLMQRPQITTLALPRSPTWPSELIPPHRAPFHFLPDVYRFAKFMLATPEYIIEDLTRDLEELAAERHILSGMKDALGVGFVNAAEENVKRQVAEALQMQTEELTDVIARIKAELSEVEYKAKKREEEDRRRKARYEGDRIGAVETVTKKEEDQKEEVPEAFLALQQQGHNVPKGNSVSKSAGTPAPSRQPRQRRNVNPPPPSTSTYYFYQAASGLPIFLHPLEIRILLSHFTSYSLFPDTIAIPVTGSSLGSVDDDLRKRCKYLAYLPESADVVFVESDLGSVVGEEGLKNFEGALKVRRTKKKEKERKEERARVKAEEKEIEKSGVRLEWGHLGWDGVRREEDVVLPVEIQQEHERPPSPVEVIPQEMDAQSPTPAQPHRQATGVWGARSFASALHSPAPVSRNARTASRAQQGRGTDRSQTREAALQDEWDMDIAWHELEQRQRGGGGNGGGGRKKKGNKLVVLGGSGGRMR